MQRPLPSIRLPVVGLSCLAALFCSQPARASSAAAWAAHRQEVVATCSQASGLSDARLVGNVIDFNDPAREDTALIDPDGNDSAGISAALISGRYRQPHMAGQTGLSLCLFNRRSRSVQTAPADGWR